METIIQRKIDAFTSGLEPTKLSIPENVRLSAQQILQTHDFPTSRDEAWKYTRLGKISSMQPALIPSTLLSSSDITNIGQGSHILVFENGYFRNDLSNFAVISGLTIKSFSELSAEDFSFLSHLLDDGNLFTALNFCYMTGGVWIDVEENVSIDEPIEIHLVQTTEQAMANPIIYVRAGNRSNFNVILHTRNEGDNVSLLNVQNLFSIGENASVTCYKLQTDSEDARQISHDYVQQASNSTFTIHTHTFGGQLVRNNLNIAINGQNCTTNLNGSYVISGKQHVDNHTIVDHTQPHCQSNELYKGVMYDQSTAVFNGKVFVRKDAQKTNAFQSNGNVLLSKDATVNSKPELEIYADDVKCSHGSTTGQLDEEAVFYLRSRGMSEAAARNLLVSAFTGEVFEKMENVHVRDYVYNLCHERFDW